ncbi:MAG: 5-amino-6-(D-ribitylamino)uracil--L-tyrosine 4-hydroxyphenyl transferase CofH [Acetobacteraceae bacterium]
MNDQLSQAALGAALSDDAIRGLALGTPLEALCEAARARRDLRHERMVTYSPKVFIPLTRLCRDTCRYCTFAAAPREGTAAYLDPDAVLAIARAGVAAGCHEALFTLGDQPERRWRAAREELARLGHPSTLSYLAAMARLVVEETGLLPHVNPGVMTEAEVAMLRTVSVSQGVMMEILSPRMSEKGGPHHGCPDKQPLVRLATLEAAGRQRVPFTTGILVGIGETAAERVETLLAIRAAHRRHGQVQEVIVQNFRAKPGTAMAAAPDASHHDHVQAIAIARLALPPEVSIQAPPNLSPGRLEGLLAAGIDDWGGISPVTIDHVNPEAPWPGRAELAARTEQAGKVLTERLPIHPAFVANPEKWLDPRLCRHVRSHADASGLARDDWESGRDERGREIPAPHLPGHGLGGIIARARDGRGLTESDIVALFAARGSDFGAVAAAADALRKEVSGEAVSYVVTRNINYTNICTYHCKFCAFSKGRIAAGMRDRPYDLALSEIVSRAEEAWERGATEVCMQGGIHPDYTGRTYLEILAAVKRAVPGLHVHAFSPLEVWQGATTLRMNLGTFLGGLKASGLGSLPGTAAEILDDEVRAVLCPDKLSTAEWLEVMRIAHAHGLSSTATIMFGHLERPVHWARHLLRLTALQRETGRITEFVPLPFVAMEAPIYRAGGARRGPTWREAVLMHAVARLALHPGITNIQTSWVKMGGGGAAAALAAGANDLGGTLMNESITRAAGAAHGQEMAPAAMDELILSLGRIPRQRTTLYGTPPREQIARSYVARPLRPIELHAPARRARQPAPALAAS